MTDPIDTKALRELLAKAMTPNDISYYLPWRVVPCDGKPTIVGARSGNLFRGYIGTWSEADLIVALVNAAPTLLASYETLIKMQGGEGLSQIVRDAVKQSLVKHRTTGESEEVIARDAATLATSALSTPPMQGGDYEQVPRVSVDDLAQEIRRVNGNNSLGAGALAEALMPFLSAAPIPAQVGEGKGHE